MGAGQTQNRLGVADTEPVIGNPRLHFRRQTEQTRRIGHGRATAAHFFGNLFLGELELRGQLVVGPRFFNRVEVFTLQVFDQSDLECFLVADLPNDGGNGRQPCFARGAPPAFPGNQLITASVSRAAQRPYQQRLDHAALLDGIGQFAELFGVEVSAGLKRAALDGVDAEMADAIGNTGGRNRAQRLRDGRGWCGRRDSDFDMGRLDRHAADDSAVDECIQSPAQRLLCHGGISTSL